MNLDLDPVQLMLVLGWVTLGVVIFVTVRNAWRNR